MLIDQFYILGIVRRQAEAQKERDTERKSTLVSSFGGKDECGHRGGCPHKEGVERRRQDVEAVQDNGFDFFGK